MTNRSFVAVATAVAVIAASSGPTWPQASGGKDQPSIRLVRPGADVGSARFEVSGVDPASLERLEKSKPDRSQWTAVFAVFVDHRSNFRDDKQPALLGSHRVAEGVIVFEPKYRLEPGLRYRAVFDGAAVPGSSGRPQKATASFDIPREQPGAPAVVEHVYPTRDRLPENQLRFYIHFSAPMSRGEAYEHVRLLDASGKPVDHPFLELGEELWDPAGKRFTLYFDPGRVKRGLKPREEAGPVLEEGKSYTLVIDRGWPDAKGNPLKQKYRKPFRAGPPDDEPIDPKKWKIQSPEAGRALPLVVTFPKPLDHAILHRLLTVRDAAGKQIAGTVAVTDEETRWHFTPERPWQPGGYRLVVDTSLEDVVGNQVGKPFEVDVFRQVQREIRPKYVTVPFEVRAK